MELDSKIYISGHKGMVGSALLSKLKELGYTNIITRSSSELDLRNQKDVNVFFQEEKPEFVFHIAAKVGGIHASNTYKADFFYDNLMISVNVIHAAKLFNTKKLLFIGSSCIYPKLAKQPMKESELLSNYLEPTNESYALAKIAGLKMCDYYREQFGCDFISIMPPNLYGENDSYHLINSHVIPSLIRKFHEGKTENKKEVEIWGTGKAIREFLNSKDLANACVFLMQNYSDYGHVNVGVGEGVSILELAQIIKNIVGYEGQLVFNTEFPDGTPVKVQDVEKIQLMGWKHEIGLEEGIKSVYEDWLKSIS